MSAVTFQHKGDVMQEPRVTRLKPQQMDIEGIEGVAPVARSKLEMDRDDKYADYWINEYGVDPDAIRRDHIFPAIQKRGAKYADGGVVFDFGCGAGSAVDLVKSLGGRSYLGLDVNQKFLSVAAESYGNKDFKFKRKNFDQSGWESDLTTRFNLGLSIFVLNELDNPRNYLRGIKRLAQRGASVSESKRGRLALVVTHPFLVLHDLTDFYERGSNQRKFENIEAYKSIEQGHYNFSRGDFAIPFKHWPLNELTKLVLDEGCKIEHFEELFFQPRTTKRPDQRFHIESQFPRALFMMLKL